MLLVLTDTHKYVLSGWVVSTGEGSKEDPISKVYLECCSRRREMGSMELTSVGEAALFEPRAILFR